jgi:hypothetical protein
VIYRRRGRGDGEYRLYDDGVRVLQDSLKACVARAEQLAGDA